MKIAYVVPGPMKREEISRRQLLLQKWASPGVTVEIIDVAVGPASVESMYEEYLGIPEAAKVIYRLDQEDYAAVVLGCAGDPGLDALREITQNVLVVGPREAGMNMAAMLGHRFSVLTVTDSRIPRGHELALIAGVRSKLVHVRALNIPVLELAQNRSAALEKLVQIGQEEVEHHHADCLVLGCMSMGFLNVAEEMTVRLGIPVMNPVRTALKTAEALVMCGLHHSKKGYAYPPKLSSGKAKSLDDLLHKRTSP